MLVLIIGLTTPYAVYAQIANSQCTRTGYPVCVEPGIVIENKYGQLTPVTKATFQLFAVFANGTIFFDVTGVVPQPDVILQFRARSYGNGTLDIRIKGPFAEAIHSPATMVNRLANASWGRGVEIAYTNQTPEHDLIINYVGIGPGCFAACSDYWTNYTYLIITVSVTCITAAVAIVLQSRVSKLDSIRPKRSPQESSGSAPTGRSGSYLPGSGE
jgi:hypothetical protein